MRANLPALEDRLLNAWQTQKLHQKLSDHSKNWPTYILHDGPPYANGHLHMGHALNKILKDIVIKYKRFQKYRVPYIPGWDCHGLPIEWKVEESYREQKKNKDDVPVLTFRAECRAFAQKWVNIQKEEFNRLGLICDWNDTYLTMNFEIEAAIVSELHRTLMNGNLYRGLKPVQWSVVEKTALAEAEIEYKEKTSSSIFVLFPLSGKTPFPEGTKILVWTTTPWTIPANRAIAFSADANYALVESQGHTFIVADPLIEQLRQTTGYTVTKIQSVSTASLEGLHAYHPLHTKGYDFTVPLLAGDHVTLDQGTGLVHTAPSHGVEDFELGKDHNLEVPELIGNDGVYYDHVPLFHGQHIFKVDPLVIDALKEAGLLFYDTKIQHSYAHSWRSKAPLIYRATSQWFISMDQRDLRENALKAMDQLNWYPPQGKNRLTSMVKNRPDWCLSRQRTWGVPIALFVHKETGEILKDTAVHQRIHDVLKEKGADAWYECTPQTFLGADYDASDYEQIFDILDVWFEAGASHAFVIEKRDDLKWPADLYLEGMDQHRGWFQSSLLHSIATRNEAPYKTLFTHGFVVDEKGYKMSKSQGNTVNLEDIIKTYGVDVLRLWVVTSDYFDDVRIGKDILARQTDVYRKIRNTFRYVLGNLENFKATDRVAHNQLEALDQWVLARLVQLDETVSTHIKTFNFHEIFKALYHFCVNDLSAFYFDIRKDRLYCDSSKDTPRKATQTVLFYVFHHLSKWLAPILTFTMEEAWTTLYPDQSIYLETFEPTNPAWKNEALITRFETLRHIRRVVTSAIETKRSSGEIRSSLEAQVDVYLEPEFQELWTDMSVEDFLITSKAVLHTTPIPNTSFQLDAVSGVGVIVTTATGHKCDRCWKIVDTLHSHSPVCARCYTVVHG